MTPSQTQNSETSSKPSSTNAIFPLGRGLQSWTTLLSASDALPISNTTFRPTKDNNALTHDTVTSPEPNSRPAMLAIFPKGCHSHSQTKGGFSFYAPGPQSVDLTTAKEVTFGYSVMFEHGFQFNKGGKLPGLYGGDNDEVATTSSGGRHDERGWSSRLMWRTGGAGEMYTYLPPSFSANQALCHVPPYSRDNPTYGTSVGRGSFSFQPGEWTTVTQRMCLNDAGQENGELELFVNGQSKINVSGLVLRSSEAGRIRGMHIQTFFGGHTAEWASPRDQKAYFSDFSIAITKNL
ncbi:hypothetical protein BGY98DRAFT_922818 [Russula aff. rugulosa BPL654]|nr:hypothetical protein BGY98DRAFT_922818 [Russula aff. rugulosa BPL654]